MCNSFKVVSINVFLFLRYQTDTIPVLHLYISISYISWVVFLLGSNINAYWIKFYQRIFLLLSRCRRRRRRRSSLNPREIARFNHTFNSGFLFLVKFFLMPIIKQFFNNNSTSTQNYNNYIATFFFCVCFFFKQYTSEFAYEPRKSVHMSDHRRYRRPKIWSLALNTLYLTVCLSVNQRSSCF